MLDRETCLLACLRFNLSLSLWSSSHLVLEQKLRAIFGSDLKY